MVSHSLRDHSSLNASMEPYESRGYVSGEGVSSQNPIAVPGTSWLNGPHLKSPSNFIYSDLKGSSKYSNGHTLLPEPPVLQGVIEYPYPGCFCNSSAVNPTNRRLKSKPEV